jgi:hypothetical protein
MPRCVSQANDLRVYQASRPDAGSRGGASLQSSEATARPAAEADVVARTT